MKPVDIQGIGRELAVKWDDGMENFIALESVRRDCPCAGCKGETDIMGNLHQNPPARLAPKSFGLIRIIGVGGYDIQPVWARWSRHRNLFL